MHPPDFGYHAHCDHSWYFCSFVEQVIQSRGSNFNKNGGAFLNDSQYRERKTQVQ